MQTKSIEAPSQQPTSGRMSSRKPRGSVSAHKPSGSPASAHQRPPPDTYHQAQQSSVLYLGQSKAKFDAPAPKVSVFFDESNREVTTLTIRPDSRCQVVVQAIDRLSVAELVLPIEKKISSIKFNSNRTVLAYYIEKSTVEFLNVSHQPVAEQEPQSTAGQQAQQVLYVLDDKRYIQPAKTKNSKLFGFIWINATRIVMITDLSVEFYLVDAARRRLRHEKTIQSPSNWYVYQPTIRPCDNSSPYSILMTSTGSAGHSMVPFLFRRNQLVKLQKFDVEGNWHGPNRLEMFERSVTIANIYGSVRLLVLQHESLNTLSKGAQILLYTVDPDSGVTTKTHTLDLNVSGRFAINILDNLVIAHDQPSKSSFVFDILIDSTEKSDLPRHYVPIIENQKIRPLRLDDKSIEMYSLNWVFFQPNFIIDAKIELLSTLHIDLSQVKTLIQDSQLLLEFLALRSCSEEVILERCEEVVSSAYKSIDKCPTIQPSPLAQVSSAFDLLSKVTVCESERAGSTPSKLENDEIPEPDGSRTPFYNNVRVNQFDIHSRVLGQLVVNSLEGLSPGQVHFIVSALLELIFSLRKHGKTVSFPIYKMLVNCLFISRRQYQLVQMVRLRMLEDSEKLALLFLSLGARNKSLYQLGIDMLHRLGCLKDSLNTTAL